MRIFLLDIQICMSSSGHVNVLQWNIEWFFSRRVKFDSSVQRHGGKLKFPDMDQKSFIASPASRNESWDGGRDPSDSPRKSKWPSPRTGRCRIKVDVLSSWSLPERLIRRSAIGKINSPCLGNITSYSIESFRVDFRCVHRFQLLKVCDQFVTPSKFTLSYSAYPRKQSR